ncbi:transposase, partial [Leptospira santarosai]|nr:transposase [Leptospira santarosai]
MNKKQKLQQLREQSNRQLRRFSESLKRQIVNDV